MRDYCEISKIETSSLRVERKLLDIDSSLIEKFDLLNSEPNENIDKNLLLLAQQNPKDKDSLMALRGRISHPISQKINLIYNQFKGRYEIELIEMLIILLEISKNQIKTKPQFIIQFTLLKKKDISNKSLLILVKHILIQMLLTIIIFTI